MFSKLFGKKSPQSNTPARSTGADPAKDPNMIRVFDEYGREVFVTRQQWRDNVLPGNLEKARNDPDQLYGMIVTAIQDGFGPDVISFAEHLKKIDPNPSRGATILGIVYMEAKRLNDAQQVFQDFIAQYGEDGIVLTNLAKVHSQRGDQTRAEEILWHALELDPNQANGLGWYAAIQKEQAGPGADLEAYRRVAKLPRSWRARLWLARDALQQKALITARTLYKEALSLAERPVPADLLMQMSGDLGTAGYLAEIIPLTSPYFDPALHGLQVGNNLIKAHLDLGQIEEAKRVLEQLYNQKRPDWKQALNFWETEIAEAKVGTQARQPHPDLLSASLIGIQGPLWTRDSSPFLALLEKKRTDAAHIAILGSTAVFEHSSGSEGPQLTNAPGRFSRAIPLKLAEFIHLSTEAVAFALIPWITDQGFALFGEPYDDAALTSLASKGEEPTDFVIGIAIDAIQRVWKLNMWIVRCSDGKRLEEAVVDASLENLGTLAAQLDETLLQWLVRHASVHKVSLPDWYQPLPPQDEQDYLVRLEQQLAVLCKHFRSMENFSLYNEREILDGALQLCLRHPSNPRARILYAQTLREMKKVRPDIVSEYKDKTERFQQKYPLSTEIEMLVAKTYAEAFENGAIE